MLRPHDTGHRCEHDTQFRWPSQSSLAATCEQRHIPVACWILEAVLVSATRRGLIPREGYKISTVSIAYLALTAKCPLFDMMSLIKSLFPLWAIASSASCAIASSGSQHERVLLQARQQTDLRILPLGDSITYGWWVRTNMHFFAFLQVAEIRNSPLR